MKKVLSLILSIVILTPCLAGCVTAHESYTIKWLNYDGTVLEVDENVAKGETPEFNGETPTKPEDDKHRYVFVNWFSVPVPAEKDVSYTAQFRAVSKVANGMLGDEVDDMAFEAGKQLVENYVPGGGIITKALDFVFKKKDDTDPGPSLADVKDDLDTMRKEISDQFSAVEADIAALSAQQEQMGVAIEKQIDTMGAQIEKVVVNQTEFSTKEASFQSLLSSIQATDLQIKTIHNSKASDQSKAVQIAMLIGRNSEWTKSSNLLNQYMNFLNTITGTTFGDLQNRDIMQILYDTFYTTDVWFTGEVAHRASFYIDKLTYLALDAYGVCIECLTAAKDVSLFTKEDYDKLDDASKKYYDSGDVLSFLDVVEAEMDYLNSKMFQVEPDDTFNEISLAHRLNDFYSKDMNIFIFQGVDKNNSGVKLDDELLIWYYSNATGEQAPGFKDVFEACDAFMAATEDVQNMLKDRIDPYYVSVLGRAIMNYAADTYPEMTVGGFFKMLGYDLSKMPDNAKYLPYLFDEGEIVGAWYFTIDTKLTDYDGETRGMGGINVYENMHGTLEIQDIYCFTLRLQSSEN